MYPTKVAYPCPPPTNNTLSSHQRSQLLRTTTKLGRILGTTPALLEESEEMPTPIPLNLQRLAVPLHAALSSKYTDDDALVRYPSSGSDTLFSSDYDTPSYMKRSPSVASDRSRSSFESAKSMPIESWPRPQTERPYLRVAIHNSPSKLADIPQSPPAYSVHAPGPNAYPHQHKSYTIAPARSPHAPAAPHGQVWRAVSTKNMPQYTLTCRNIKRVFGAFAAFSEASEKFWLFIAARHHCRNIKSAVPQYQVGRAAINYTVPQFRWCRNQRRAAIRVVPQFTVSGAAIRRAAIRSAAFFFLSRRSKPSSVLCNCSPTRFGSSIREPVTCFSAISASSRTSCLPLSSISLDDDTAPAADDDNPASSPRNLSPRLGSPTSSFQFLDDPDMHTHSYHGGDSPPFQPTGARDELEPYDGPSMPWYARGQEQPPAGASLSLRHSLPVPDSDNNPWA